MGHLQGLNAVPGFEVSRAHAHKTILVNVTRFVVEPRKRRVLHLVLLLGRVQVSLRVSQLVVVDPVHGFEVAAEVARLGEGLGALRALEGAQTRVLAEVVPKVALLFEDASTVPNPTPEK